MRSFFKRKRHSLTTRLVFLFVVMAVLFLILVGSSLRWAFRANFQESIRPHLFRYMEYIQKDLGSPPEIAKAEAIVNQLPVEIHIFGPEGSWSSTGEPLKLEDVHYHRRFTENGADYAFGRFSGKEYLINWRSDHTLAFSVPHARGSWHWRKAFPLAILLVMLVVLYYYTRRIFAPIQQIRAGVERIGEGEMGHRIHLERNDELGELAGSINRMADDIQQMLEAKRQLLLALSHELRSPLTRVKVAVEMLKEDKLRQEMHKDIDAIDQLIAELLETERLSSRHRALNKAPIDCVALVKETLDSFFADATIALDLPEEETFADIDATRVRLLIKNLVDNALRHNRKDAPPPKVSLKEKDSAIEFAVEDFGPGIHAAHLPYLAEPFYRVDPARQRQTGGYGLGLYLCRVIAEAHGGKLEIASEKDKGTTVTVCLPVENNRTE